MWKSLFELLKQLISDPKDRRIIVCAVAAFIVLAGGGVFAATVVTLMPYLQHKMDIQPAKPVTQSTSDSKSDKQTSTVTKTNSSNDIVTKRSLLVRQFPTEYDSCFETYPIGMLQHACVFERSRRMIAIYIVTDVKVKPADRDLKKLFDPTGKPNSDHP